MSPLGGLKITGNYLPRRYRLLLGAVFFIGSPLPAFAQSADDQELAAIKAEMRMLEGRLQAIEQRRHAGSASHAARPNAPKTSVARRLPIKGETPKIETARAATSPSSPASSIPRPSSGIMPVSTAGFAPDSVTAGSTTVPATPIVTPAHQTPPPLFQWLGNQHNEAHRTSIDLTSSSPLAITQTEVDHLPPVFQIGNLTVRLGGFIDFSNIWRSSNMTSGPATAWNNFPYANSPNHGLSEERFSAQLSRFSTLLEANPTKSVRLQAYVESDFGGSGGTTNSVQINGYTPRLRQGYFTFTQKDWGLHVLMGQAWSLTTNYAKGVIPRQEQLPAVTDNNQIPGITFTRVPQIRIAKDWDKKYWIALSIEDPQATVGFSDTLSSGGTLPASYGRLAGPRVYYANSGGVLLNPNTQYSYNPAPDIVLKTAVDTSFGHYEVFGLARWFRGLVQPAGENHTHKSTQFGGGVGAGMTVPLGTNKLQLTGNVLAGQGVGRYGPSLIPDTTFDSNGNPTPIPEIMGSLGLVGHPARSVLLYTYGGVESAGRRTYLGADGIQHGYGATDLNLSGCEYEFGTCSAQTRTLASLTTGGWWHFLDGHYGSVMGGLQYTYIRKFAFKGNDGADHAVDPTTYGHTVYVTFRYYPFQQ
ncbi:hypothetical protein [Gluconobacter oxydans]|uniref:Porin n=1 Tax=Gluconobacter oxydans NBRC 3293 TaxID=1315969 RepID=A0A829WRG7_GLUOY|nr:hypothetical protein [Gluconobacter oxydans]GEM17765.1 hypothetical protein NBRC3293_2262 [Gluconobacter oxydans NBRC 3293]